MKSTKRQCHEWVAVAACEFVKIIRHLGLKSISQAAKELDINYRTLKKLDERHPDSSLTLEKLMEIWHSLEVFASVIQSPERAVEESRFISDSMMRIMRSFPLNSRLQGKVGAACSGMIGGNTQGR